MGRRLKPIKHGTPNGYRQEIWRGNRTCRSCRQAWAVYCRPFSRTRHRVEGLTPPPTPEQVIEEIIRDSQD